MSDLQAYFLAIAERKTEQARRDAAGTALELAWVRERLAQIQSQHEPLASLLAESRSERDRLYAAAFWVVIGRMPEPTDEREEKRGEGG